VKLVAYAPRAADGTHSRQVRIGLWTDRGISDLTGRGVTDLATLIAGGERALELLAGAGPAGDAGDTIDPATVSLRAPLPRPGKIVCVGLNYRDHCREQEIEPPAWPRLFAKFANAVTDPGAPVTRPRMTEQLDLEAELAIVIGRRASHMSRERAMEAVWGYTVLNDVTMRDLQREDRQWLRAKGSDGFAPMGPAVVTRDEIVDPQRLRIRSSVNGEAWQDSTTAEMVFDIPTLVAFVSRAITLEPGDLIATGTPAGVGHFQRPPRYLFAGDVMRCEIEGIGAIENPVIDEEPRTTEHAAAAGVAELFAEVPA
jgi:2-keto-4-pentenoate hydratase/2-oxohepta-3-ene-1,7-dioic acid hydratase in catechol pathway